MEIDILNKTIDAFFTVFEASPIEVMVILIFVGILLWLSKEIGIQLARDREQRNQSLEKSLSVLSNILIEWENSKRSPNAETFYHTIYAAIPFIDYNLSKDLILLVAKEDISDDEKTKEAVEKVKKEILELSYYNKNLFKTSLLYDGLEKLLLKIWRIFEPIVFAASIMYVAFIILLIGTPWENDFWKVVKPASFILTVLLLILAIDLIREKKLTKIGNSLFIIVIIMLIATVVTPERYSVYFLISFILALIILLYGGFKKHFN